jgi:subtilase family serine protease
MLTKALHRFVIFAGLALASIGINRAQAQDDILTSGDPAIGAEVLQVDGVQDLGQRAGSLPIDVVVTLRYNHIQELEQLVAEQSDATSANYRKYLTNAEFSERFGPTAEQLERVTTELQRAGFQITKTTSDRVLVYAKAPSALVESYFKTEIHTFG